jgi:hypothetical protein
MVRRHASWSRSDVDPVDGDATLRGRVEAGEEFRERRLPGSVQPDDGNLGPEGITRSTSFSTSTSVPGYRKETPSSRPSLTLSGGGRSPDRCPRVPVVLESVAEPARQAEQPGLHRGGGRPDPYLQVVVGSTTRPELVRGRDASEEREEPATTIRRPRRAAMNSPSAAHQEKAAPTSTAAPIALK